MNSLFINKTSILSLLALEWNQKHLSN